jgi:predicted DNA-binding protein (MmcQ/YjbR family)
MTLDEYDAYCAALPHATFVAQWQGAHVWKIAGERMFAFAYRAGGDESDRLAGIDVTFKVSPLSFEILRETPGCRPAPYMASRGLVWIQSTAATALDDATLAGYLGESHRLVAAGLSRKRRQQLGFPVDPFRRYGDSLLNTTY